MKTKLYFAIFTAVFSILKLNAQTNVFPSAGSAGIGTTTPNASSALEIKSTSQGILISRMTKAKRDSIVAPATGLMIYQTNNSAGFYYYDGSAWLAVTTPAGANRSLSNLNVTAVNQHLVPQADNMTNIGSSNFAWKDAYFGGDIYFDARRFISNAGNANTFVGDSAAINNTTGNNNTVIGFRALYSNTGGSSNTALGSSALYSNTTGAYNSVNGFKAMYFNSTGNLNTANGYQALYNNTAGKYNAANGASALYSNTIGDYNTANGYNALYFNTTGDFNTANGASALHYNTTGKYNAANGYNALFHNTTGNGNTAGGYQSLYYSNTGNYNTSNGYRSLFSNTTGSGNTAEGYQALYSNTTGYSNVAIGVRALYSATTRSNLIAVGDSTLYSNTTGNSNVAIGTKVLYSNTTGGNNVGTGAGALYSNTTGQSNTAYGSQALHDNTTGGANVAMGLYPLNANTTGDHNVGIGFYSLAANSTGHDNVGVGRLTLHQTSFATFNTAVGSLAGSESSGDSANTFIGFNANSYEFNRVYNSTCLGYYSRITASNQVRIGNANVTSIGGYVGWSNLSDGRVKKNVKENVPGLIFINKLKPVTYSFDLDAVDKIIRPTSSKHAEMVPPMELKSDENSKMAYTGFIAQDVEKAAKEIGYDFSGVDVAKNENDLYGLRYAEFVVPLVKAVQELSKEVEDLKSQLNELSKNQNTNISQSSTDGTVKISVDQPAVSLLGQNIPNPFDRSTIIPFRIPKGCKDATIVFAQTGTGKIVRAIPVNCGETQLSLDAGALSAGTYMYSLYVDGKLIDTKQMVLTK